MQRKTCAYVTQNVVGEPYKVYVPAKLPPDPPLELAALYPALERATQAIAELNSLHQAFPHRGLFLDMYVRKEALLSSQIEGTQSSFSDLMFFEHNLQTEVSLDDVEEVSNYVRAIQYGLKRLKEDDFP